MDIQSDRYPRRIWSSPGPFFEGFHLGLLGAGWSYGLGWYARGNWVAMAGGTVGSMAIVIHNRAYDFTVVYLTNVIGNPIGTIMNPLLSSPNKTWTQPNGVPQSILGGEFPCLDDPSTMFNECTTLGMATPY